MNADIIWLTGRQLLGKRRTLLFSLFAMLPPLLAVAFRMEGSGDPGRWTANALLAWLIVAVVLPLAALVFGTAAIGSEIEDGTAVYLLSKPRRRSEILLSKLLVAWLVTAGFVLVSALVAGLIAVQDSPDRMRILAGFSVGVVTGSLAYCAVFALLSIVTSRAFVAGLLYVFVWEGLITRLFSGTRILSIRQSALGIAGYIADVSPRVYDPELGGVAAVIISIVVVAGAIAVGIWRLRLFEMGETG